MPSELYPAAAASIDDVRARPKLRGASLHTHLLYRAFVTPAGCWEWAMRRQPNGYGRISTDGRAQLVHRAAYREFVGPIPDGVVIDHLCCNRACINPAHLRACSQQDNVTAAHSQSPPALCARQTHCKNGHEFNAENTTITAQGKRQCRECRLASDRRRAATPARQAYERERSKRRAAAKH